jgi:hypothetical protein
MVADYQGRGRQTAVKRLASTCLQRWWRALMRIE